MKQMVSFEKVKLTNNELDQHGHVSFNSALYILDKNYGGFMNRSFKLTVLTTSLFSIIIIQ